MKKYLILDDIVPIEYQNLLLETFGEDNGEIQWKFSTGEYRKNEFKKRTIGNESWDGYIQLVKNIFAIDPKTKMPMFTDEDYFSLVSSVLSLLLIKFGLSFSFYDLERIKVNFGLRQPLYPKDSHGPPHVDGGSKWTMIYYINDSDGDTILFNENVSFFNQYEDSGYIDYGRLVPKEYTILTRVQPKQGRILLFKGDQYHAGNPPIKNLSRGIINYCFNTNYNFLV